MMRRLAIICLCTGMAAFTMHVAQAEIWTNVAGHTIDATALEMDGKTVVFERPNGEIIRMPVFSLARDEQQRISEKFHGPAIPAALQPLYTHAEVQLERARLLRTEEQLSDREYADRHANIIRTLKRGCEEQGYAENSPEVQQLITRLTTQ